MRFVAILIILIGIGSNNILQQKDVILDNNVEECKKQSKEISHLKKDNKYFTAKIEELQEVEKIVQELQSHSTVNAETIITLQKDLISEKLNNESMRTWIEKLGITFDLFDSDINTILKKLLNNPDVAKFAATILGEGKEFATATMTEVVHETENTVTLTESELLVQSDISKTLQAENARLQVDIATLASQISSLSSQQTALQLANSQLVAEKEEVNLKNFS